MSQTRLQSLTEAHVSTAVGFVVSLIATPPILWLFGYPPTGPKALGITLIYTALSLVRGYGVRRYFARKHG